MPYQISLPYKKSSERGFEHINDVVSSVVQDFKTLLLTIPGEKINDPNFGVGIQTYLFESPSEIVKEQIRNSINEKAGIYLPFLKIISITYEVIEEKLLVYLSFSIGNETNVSEILLNFNIDPLQANANPIEI